MQSSLVYRVLALPLDFGGALKKLFGQFAKKPRGFTLVELVIALGILAVLSGVVALSFTTLVGNAAESACAVDERHIQTAVYSYHYDTGAWPTADSGDAAVIQWADLVPGYLNAIPSGDDDCGWGIDTGGTVCATQADCGCGTSCTDF